MPGADQLAGAPVAAALGDRGGHQVARAGQPREGLAAAAARERELVHLREDPSRGRAGEVGALHGGRGGGERRGVLGAGGQLGAGHVVGRLDRQAAGVEHLAELAAQVAVARGDDHRGADLDRLARVHGAAQAGDRARAHALGHVGARRGAERRHEALGGDQHGAAVAHARADLADRGGQAAAGHGEHDQVDAAELDLAHGLGLDRPVERHAGQVGGVLAVVEQPGGLRRRAAAELHLEPGAREHRRDRGAHRAAAHHGGGAQRRQAAEPLPLEPDAGPDALGHLAGQERRRVVHARVGERGAAAQVHAHRLDLPAVARVLGSGHRDRHHGRAALEGEPPDAALRLARASPSGCGCPRGRSRRRWPRSSSASAVFTDSSSDSPRRTGKAPMQLRNQPISRLRNSSCLATKKIGRLTAQPIANGSRKLRWLAARITPPAGHVLAAQAAEAEVEQDGRLDHRPDGPVDQRVDPPASRPLVVERSSCSAHRMSSTQVRSSRYAAR